MISIIKSDEIGEASIIIRESFNEFAMADYSVKGIEYFYNIISEQSIYERFYSGNTIFVSKQNDKITGYIEITGLNHIYLLFVNKNHQRAGIAGSLVDACLIYLLKQNSGLRELTVNSTPYALKFYEKAGFKKIADFQMKNDILSYPMRLTVS